MNNKHIKKVFGTASEVLHLWANQSQSDARTSGQGRVYFEGESCYSYGSHYELGRIITYKGIKMAIVNNTGYSNTTVKHIGYASSAVDGLMPYLKAGTFNVKEALLENQSKLIDELMGVFSQRSMWYKNFNDNSWLCNQVKAFNVICVQLGHQEYILDVFQSDLISLLDEHIKAMKNRRDELKSPEAQAKREAARIKREELLAKKNAASVIAWRAGGPTTTYIQSMRPMLLRYHAPSSMIQTSGGASVPLDEAKQLLWRIELGSAKEGTPIGSYTFNNYDKITGIVKIGCHTIKLEEAKQLLNN